MRQNAHFETLDLLLGTFILVKQRRKKKSAFQEIKSL